MTRSTSSYSELSSEQHRDQPAKPTTGTPPATAPTIQPDPIENQFVPAAQFNRFAQGQTPVVSWESAAVESQRQHEKEPQEKGRAIWSFVCSCLHCLPVQAETGINPYRRACACRILTCKRSHVTDHMRSMNACMRLGRSVREQISYENSKRNSCSAPL